MMSIKGKKVELSTFLKYGKSDVIGYKTLEESGSIHVNFIWCKICAKHKKYILKEQPVRGNVKTAVKAFIEGTNVVTKHQIMRHLAKSAGHKLAVQLELNEANSIPGLSHPEDEPHIITAPMDYVKPTIHKPEVEIVKLDLRPVFPSHMIELPERTSPLGCQPALSAIPKIEVDHDMENPNSCSPDRISDLVEELHENSSRAAYKNLMRTAYEMALNPQYPLSVFKLLVKCLRITGVRVVAGHDSCKSAGEFLQAIAQVVVDKVAGIISRKNVMAVLFDVSQEKISKSDKEMVLVRVEHNGLPVYFTVALLENSEHEATNAEALCSDINSVFGSGGNVPLYEYNTKLISCAVDGANLNLEDKSALLQNMGTSREWLLKVNCINHRIESSIILALKESQFHKVEEFYQDNFKLLKKYPKLKSYVQSSAAGLGIVHRSMSRLNCVGYFENRIRACENILDMWPVFLDAYMNGFEERSLSTSKCEISDVLDKFRSYRMLCLVNTYKDILEKIMPFIKVFEDEGLLANEVSNTVNLTLMELQDLIDSAGTESESRFWMESDEEGTKRLKGKFFTVGDDLSKTVVIELKDMVYLSELSSYESSNAKVEVTQQISAILKEKFKDFAQEIYGAMKIFDPKTWPTKLKDFGNDELVKIGQHFQKPLELSGFEQKMALQEWKQVKKYIEVWLRHLATHDIWKNILTYKRAEFPNLCYLVEIFITIGGSNSTVERAFGTLTNMLTNQSLCCNHNIMEAIFIIQTNDKHWSQKEREEIIRTALDIYLRKKKKRKMATSNSPNKVVVLYNTENAVAVPIEIIESSSEENEDSSDGEYIDL